MLSVSFFLSFYFEYSCNYQEHFLSLRLIITNN